MSIQDIQARHDAIGEGAGGTPAMDIGDGWQAHEDREELLAEIHGAAAALAALGVTGEGTLAERILEVAAGAKYAAHYREGTHQMRLSLDAEKIAKGNALHDLDILRRAAIAAATTLGEEVPEDAGPETIAKALREGAEREKGRREGRRAALAPCDHTRFPHGADAAGTYCTDCGDDVGQPPDADALSLSRLSGTREATIAKLPADILAQVLALDNAADDP